VEQLVDGTYDSNKELFRDLYNSLLYSDTYFVLKDFRPYAAAHKQIENVYQDRELWGMMALLNTACCGKFSADRTIQQYVDEVWHLPKIVL
jgi:starch phosphorylase